MKIEVCKGQAGLALYVDDTRVAGVRDNGVQKTILSAEVNTHRGEPVAWQIRNSIFEDGWDTFGYLPEWHKQKNKDGTDRWVVRPLFAI